MFSDLQSVGYNTDLVIPSLLLGQRVDKVRSDFDGEPMFQLGGGKEWRPFDAHATLFADAQRLGWTTGVVGWFNPYCRILQGTLDYCFWRMGDGELKGPISTKSSLENAISPIQNTVWDLEGKPDFFHRVHAADLAGRRNPGARPRAGPVRVRAEPAGRARVPRTHGPATHRQRSPPQRVRPGQQPAG